MVFSITSFTDVLINFFDRKLLCDVVRVKMKIYDYMKTRTQSSEEYLKTFLESEIKPLWPKGWMQTR
jgi:ubinuclein